MNYDFKSYLQEQLEYIKLEHGYDCNIEIAQEQAFAEMDKFTPNTIYIVVRFLSSDIQYDAETTPVQLSVVSEQNSVKMAFSILDDFTIKNNWKVLHSNNVYVKQQWNSPVVLNNYVEVGYGFRSTLYVSGTLYIMDNVLDVTNLQYVVPYQEYDPQTQTMVTKYHRYDLKPLSFNFSYVMTPNTQPIGSNKMATSVKNISVFSISFFLTLKDNELLQEILKISNQTISGNQSFNMCFKIGTLKYGQVEDTDTPLEFKLTLAQVITDPEKVPSIQIGMQL